MYNKYIKNLAPRFTRVSTFLSPHASDDIRPWHLKVAFCLWLPWVKSCKFQITLNIHCFYITLFIFNQFSISILCGVMFIIIVFDAQILVSWLPVDVHIRKISNSTLLCPYFIHIHTHTHTYYKFKATQIYFFKKLKEKFTTTHT